MTGWDFLIAHWSDLQTAFWVVIIIVYYLRNAKS